LHPLCRRDLAAEIGQEMESDPVGNGRMWVDQGRPGIDLVMSVAPDVRVIGPLTSDVLDNRAIGRPTLVGQVDLATGSSRRIFRVGFVIASNGRTGDRIIAMISAITGAIMLVATTIGTATNGIYTIASTTCTMTTLTIGPGLPGQP